MERSEIREQTLELHTGSAPDFASLHSSYKRATVAQCSSRPERSPGLPGSRQISIRAGRRHAKSSPCLNPATGQAATSCSVVLPRKERCGTRWQKAASATRPVASRAARTPFESQRHTSGGSARRARVVKAEPGPRKQPFACVPHADGFVGLLRCPRDRSAAADLTPFVRAVARTFTRAVRSRHRRLPRPLAERPWIRRPRPYPRAPKPGIVCGPPRPVPCREDDRGTLRVGTGRPRRYLVLRPGSRTNHEL